jgi:hypothetical protein
LKPPTSYTPLVDFNIISTSFQPFEATKMDPRSLDPVWTESQPIATMDPNAGKHDRPTADDGRGAPGLGQC